MDDSKIRISNPVLGGLRGLAPQNETPAGFDHVDSPLPHFAVPITLSISKPPGPLCLRLLPPKAARQTILSKLCPSEGAAQRQSSEAQKPFLFDLDFQFPSKKPTKNICAGFSVFFDES